VGAKDGQPGEMASREGGYFEVTAETGRFNTRCVRRIGTSRLNFARAEPANGEDQDRGNSFVFLMAFYKFRCLYPTKANVCDGRLRRFTVISSLVNVFASAVQWQTYDIIFHRPRFDPSVS